ncbi:MAG: small ribosomal subunit Rsm22 family protein, partial [Methanoregulaceae archaeon]|nr:small ribosomal subunit Rsm22 family protein [Methanoregulaceae archaeon]
PESLSRPMQDPAYRDNMTSKPVPEKPILSKEEIGRTNAFLAAGVFPPSLEELVHLYIGKKTGKQWDDPVVLERIRTAIMAQKNVYWREGAGRRIGYQSGYSVLGYLAYHFPVYFFQAEHLLLQMALDGVLKRTMTILDAGSGPGVVSLAAIDFFSRFDEGRLTLYSIERAEEQVEAYRYLVEGFARGRADVTVTRPVACDIRGVKAGDLPGPADLIVFQNVLNEMEGLTPERRAEVVSDLAASLSPGGAVLIVEPADKVNSIELRKTVRKLFASGFSLHRPCIFLWGSRCTNERCWTFVEKSPIHPTTLQKALAGSSEMYRFLNTDIKYSYAILTWDHHRGDSAPLLSPGAPFSRFSTLRRHVGRKINIVAAVMSGDLGNRRDHVFLLCDGTAGKPVYAILPRHQVSGGNRALLGSGYGEVLEIHGVLVHYNPAHDAYNLLVRRGARVSSRKPASK